jgi:hypothetical protein
MFAAFRRRALEILRHHWLLETFLYKVLDYTIKEVHEDAERLDHFIFECFEERIDAKLGRPKFDPHGHGIPALDGKILRQTSRPLVLTVFDCCEKCNAVIDGKASARSKIPIHNPIQKTCGLTRLRWFYAFPTGL